MLTTNARPLRNESFLRVHSLSLVTLAILILWVGLYIFSDPNKHAGAFFGNAIADWSGTLVVIVGTKYLLERRSAESLPVKGHVRGAFQDFVRAHSLSIFLVLTGLGWLALYMHMDATSKWGQVVGNIVSEWLQTLGLVLMTKKLLERGSKESRAC